MRRHMAYVSVTHNVHIVVICSVYCSHFLLLTGGAVNYIVSKFIFSAVYNPLQLLEVIKVYVIRMPRTSHNSHVTPTIIILSYINMSSAKR